MLPEFGSSSFGAVECLTVVFVLLYWRSLPFVYHLRFLAHALWAYFKGPRPDRLSDFTEISLRVWPDDIDFNWHMGNSR